MLHFSDRIEIMNAYQKARKQIATDCGKLPDDTVDNFLNFLSGHIQKIDKGVYLITVKVDEEVFYDKSEFQLVDEIRDAFSSIINELIAEME